MPTVFFDTEFTTASEQGIRKLISIGCIAQTGEEFYCELADTYHEGLCSDWVIQNVLPLLQGGEYRMTEAELAARLKEWVESLGEKEVIFRSDHPELDWPWVEQLFTLYGCWPKNVRRKFGTIYFSHDYQTRRYQDALAEYWKENSACQHHALIDARSFLFAWKRAIKRGV